MPLLRRFLHIRSYLSCFAPFHIIKNKRRIKWKSTIRARMGNEYYSSNVLGKILKFRSRQRACKKYCSNENCHRQKQRRKYFTVALFVSLFPVWMGYMDFYRRFLNFSVCKFHSGFTLSFPRWLLRERIAKFSALIRLSVNIDRIMFTRVLLEVALWTVVSFAMYTLVSELHTARRYLKCLAGR